MKLTDEQVDSICARYLAGEDSPQLAAEFGVTAGAIVWRLYSRGIKPRRGKVLTDAQMAAVCVRYTAGEDSPTLAAEYGVTFSAICSLLDRRGVARRSQQVCRRRYSCNHEYFRYIDTDAKAYWLGFLAADGNVTREGIVRLDISERDEAHLFRFREALQSDHPVTRRQRQNSTTVRIGISSQSIAADLARWGVVPGKTTLLRWPSVSEDALAPFMRGYVDGDGSFCICRTGRGRTMHRFSVIGPPAFLHECREFLVARCALSRTAVFPASPKSPVSVLAWCGEEPVRRIARSLYDDATVFLPRKKSVMLP